MSITIIVIILIKTLTVDLYCPILYSNLLYKGQDFLDSKAHVRQNIRQF